MVHGRQPLLRYARFLVMGMLALAIIAKPVLAEFCNAHAIAHAAAEAAGQDAHADSGDSAGDARSDHDHASGKHQTLHAYDASPAYVEPFPALGVPPARFAAQALPAYTAAAPPARRPDSPLRPPIA